MQKVTILCTGKLKEKFYLDAVAEYVKRLNRFCKLEIIELPEQRLPQTPSEGEIAQALEKEAALIESKLLPGASVIAMCVEGKPMSSEQLADYFGKLTVSGTSKICVLIGGSGGLSERVKKKAALRLSMSPMTFPHHLARVMVLEQIYRALNIAASTTSKTRNSMTKEQIAAIAVVLLLGAVFFVRLYRRQQEPPKEPPKPRPLPKTGKIRCPMCGAEAKVTGKQWECPWCGDCGWIK